MIVPEMFVCSSFLLSACMFIVSKALLISSATVIVRAGGTIWLKPFATVLFSVCSAVTVECCGLYPCCMGVFGMFAVIIIIIIIVMLLLSAPPLHRKMPEGSNKRFYALRLMVSPTPHLACIRAR